MEDDLAVKKREGGGSFMAAVFDGHGGRGAAQYAKSRLFPLLETSCSHEESVKEAMRSSFLKIHSEMSSVRESWTSTREGYLSTSGTTATVVVLQPTKLYIGNVGDSAGILAVRGPFGKLFPKPITANHRPNNYKECQNIEQL
ncbi:PREDICTED: protein phosphatase 1D-like, partial [Amphimedon queenslandica]